MINSNPKASFLVTLGIDCDPYSYVIDTVHEAAID